MFKPGKNKWDWLGTGVYFWIENEKMADLWGNKLRKIDAPNGASDYPVVMTCTITLGNCLNLADASDMSGLLDYTMRIQADGVVLEESNDKAEGEHPLPGEEIYRYLDHRLIDSYNEHTGNITNTVLGVFNNGKPIYPNSKILTYNSIQLAVRKNAVASIKVNDVRPARRPVPRRLP